MSIANADEAIAISNLKMAKENLNTFVSKNIYFTLHTSLKYSEVTLNQTNDKVGIITFLESNFSVTDFLEEANKISKYGEKAAWLIVDNCHYLMTIMNKLRHASFDLEADIVIAADPVYSVPLTLNTLDNTTQWNISFSQTEDFLPFQYMGNQTLNLTQTCFEKDNSSSSNQESYLLYQIYKIKRNMNTSLVAHKLGIWDPVNITRNLKPFVDSDSRQDFYKFPLIFGVVNTAAEGTLKESDIAPKRKHFANYIADFYNTSKIFVGFIKIGHRENGEWTDFLSSIKSEDIDLSAEGVSRTLERTNDFTFSYTIIRNTRNIYIEPAESQKMRDIFLVPFDYRLILCVVGTGLILATVITLNNIVDSRFCSKDIQNRTKSFSESVVWCIGVFSQQGSIWKTRTNPEKIIVLISLMFTLLIYNSYSAFITSVLSVELSSIRSVKDLLESDYTIGYAKDSQDEDYLRSVNISELKQIYLRGYIQNDISNISEGLQRVIGGNYGLFASGEVARPEIANLSNWKCKFDIDEIKIQYTQEYFGIVMSKKSPYKRLINLSVSRMYETGIYDYIISMIYPELMKCEKPKTFQSARLADLSTAFFILLFGCAASFTIMILECCWKKRHRIYKNIKKRWGHEQDFHISRYNQQSNYMYSLPPRYPGNVTINPGQTNKFHGFMN
ncbi:glutamate receptor ionotropic, delta-1-like [Diabrotica undecimpunctata]|uniref:glutamate receptor ionotropic, delta-1-like n=1 Tax=Diabrotica undecimpunctata TaxID=50387 RepID=UPI003B634EE3